MVVETIEVRKQAVVKQLQHSAILVVYRYDGETGTDTAGRARHRSHRWLTAPPLHEERSGRQPLQPVGAAPAQQPVDSSRPVPETRGAVTPAASQRPTTTVVPNQRNFLNKTHSSDALGTDLSSNTDTAVPEQSS